MKYSVAKVIESLAAILFGVFIYAVIYPSIAPSSERGMDSQSFLWGVGITVLVFLVIQP